MNDSNLNTNQWTTSIEQSNHPRIVSWSGIVTVRAQRNVDLVLDVLVAAAGETELGHRGVLLLATDTRQIVSANIASVLSDLSLVFSVP